MALPRVTRPPLTRKGKYVNFGDGKAEKGRTEEGKGKDYRTRPVENRGKIGSA